MAVNSHMIENLTFGHFSLVRVGDLDYGFNKGNNTRIGARSAYCMRKHNKSAQW